MTCKMCLKDFLGCNCHYWGRRVPYGEGYEAYNDAQHAVQYNPYQEDTAAWSEWEDGYATRRAELAE